MDGKKEQLANIVGMGVYFLLGKGWPRWNSFVYVWNPYKDIKLMKIIRIRKYGIDLNHAHKVSDKT